MVANGLYAVSCLGTFLSLCLQLPISFLFIIYTSIQYPLKA